MSDPRRAWRANHWCQGRWLPPPPSSSIFVLALLVLLFGPSGNALASLQTLTATLTGGHEVPSNGSPATGTCTVSVNPATFTVSFSGTFSGLSASATSATLRGLAAPSQTGPAMLSAATLTASASGTFAGSGQLTPEQVSGMLMGQSYCEVADAVFPSGEIRGQLTSGTSAPALPTGGLTLLGLALMAMGLAAQRQMFSAQRLR
jgi:hypothetical protein